MKKYTIDGTFFLGEYGKTQCLFLPAVDSMEKGSSWGRLHVDLKLSRKGICHIYVLADDTKPAVDSCMERAAFFHTYGKKAGTNCCDMLLNELRGRYLWICIEAAAGGAELGGIFLENPGDEFMQMFPEVYQEPGGFFERYLSIMSTIYRDMQGKIDGSAHILDVDVTDRELVRRYMRWFGFSAAGAGLTPQEERLLLPQLYWLNRRKGTKAAVLRLCNIFLGMEPAVMYVKDSQLFLLFTREINHRTIEKFRSILDRFLPAGCKAQIVRGKEPAGCDGHSYMDINSIICAVPPGALDEEKVCGSCVLEGEHNGILYSNCEDQ